VNKKKNKFKVKKYFDEIKFITEKVILYCGGKGG